MAEPPTSPLLEMVGRLQSGLLCSPPPRKLLKHLQKLSDLPITLDILVGTGIGKTVNALTKYERVAVFARGLVAQWKKLVHVIATATEPEKRLSRKRPGGTLPTEREVEGHDGKNGKALCSGPPHSPESWKRKYRKLDKNLEGSPHEETRERERSRGGDKKGKGEKEGGDAKKGETGKRKRKGKRVAKAKGESRKRRKQEKGETGEVWTKQDTKAEKNEGKIRDGKRSGNQFSLSHSSNCELSNMSHVSSPQASTNPQQMSIDYGKPQEKKADQLRPPQKSHKRHSHAIQDKEGENPKRRLVKPEVRVAVHHHHHQRKGHKSFEKRKTPVSDKGKHFELSQEDLQKVVSRDEGSNPSSKTSPKKKQAALSAPKREKKTEGSSDKKKSEPPSEMAPGKCISKPKDKGTQKAKMEKFKLSVDNLYGESQNGELTPEIKGKESSNKLKTQKRTEALNANKTPSKIQGTQESEGDDGSEPHFMSFESYLLYDQPKKGRAGKTPNSGTRREGHPKLKSVKPEMEGHGTVKNLLMENSSLSEKNQAGAGSANPPKSSDGIPASPALQSCSGSSSGKDICHTLWSVQAVYHPLSSGELNPAFWLKKQVLSTPQENRVPELPMSRVNSKTKVYSGSQNSYIPKILSLFEQCIRVLGKNIDLIYEVGQVPYHLLIPVLERCSPEQLYRIEDYNPIFLEDSDPLWKVHCFRYFRKEQPEEFESWREMYLRLHDAQEQRLYRLTDSIKLAHARRPKGRQTKMLFINPKSRSPYDVPGSQMLRVGGTVVLKNARVKAIQHTLSSRNSPDTGDCHAQDKEPSDGPSTSSTLLAPSGSNASSEHSKKTSGKKAAPVMAKSIKTFKNRLAQL